MCPSTAKGAIDQGTLHEETLAKLRHLEQKPQQTPRQEEVTTQAPVFTQPIRDVHAAEGQPLHFEGRLIPVGDETMKVEWFKNGVPLQQGKRGGGMMGAGGGGSGRLEVLRRQCSGIGV